MGAKQSKRSVDISGKEAEGAGEVAAAGAGGEGRMEPLADVDALKPQANGEAHIHEEPTEKEKQLDSGTPENEKDATTEKENKDQEDKENEVIPLTNGDGEPKQGNGDSTPAPEDAKKPKKEKVKKKWSLRSISFSRKDKPKQDKKQKDDEQKTNGEAEKVSEEAAEAATPETVKESTEEAKSESAEVKEEKTPETPVTEPLTNGSSTPESPKVESPTSEEPTPPANPAPAPDTAPASEPEKPELKVELEPEKLPINGLTLEEPNEPTSKTEESKPADSAPETKETVPEIPVKIEVCVEQKPVESLPPPLPANPPPSNAASFAASTMAPDLDASLLTSTETLPTLTHVISDNNESQAQNQPISELAPSSKVTTTSESEIKDTLDSSQKLEINSSDKSNQLTKNDDGECEILVEQDYTHAVSKSEESSEISAVETKNDVNVPTESTNEINISETVLQTNVTVDFPVPTEESNILIVEMKVGEKEKNTMQSKVLTKSEKLIQNENVIIEQKNEVIEVQFTSDNTVQVNMPVTGNIPDIVNVEKPNETEQSIMEPNVEVNVNNINSEFNVPSIPIPSDIEIGTLPLPEENELSSPESTMDSQESSEELPPPPPPLDDSDILIETVVNIHNVSEIDEPIEAKRKDDVATEEVISTIKSDNEITNGNITEKENLKNKSKDLVSEKTAVQCNGNAAEASELCTPDPPRPTSPLQESLTVSDKIADLIPEVPVVPDLNTETLQETTVAVDN